MMKATLAFCPSFDVFFFASIAVDCTAQVCERVCLFQWLSIQCDGVVVLCVGFRNLPPVVVESSCVDTVFSMSKELLNCLCCQRRIVYCFYS